jgi:DNA-binding LytR/AlgR family response regulator
MPQNSPPHLRLTPLAPTDLASLPLPRPLHREGGRAVGRIAARRGRSLVLLDASDVWAFEADRGLTFVHSAYGRLDIDVTLTEIEASSVGADCCRVHRSWLVNLASVRVLETGLGGVELVVGPRLAQADGLRVPVSRDRVRAVREVLLAGTIGLRRRDREGVEEEAASAE